MSNDFTQVDIRRVHDDMDSNGGFKITLWIGGNRGKEYFWSYDAELFEITYSPVDY